MHRPGHRILILAAALGLSVTAAVAPAQASPAHHTPAHHTPAHQGDEPFCGQRWGSLPETQTAWSAGQVVADVRSGRHACFDRLVVDLRGGTTGPTSYDVRYVEAVGGLGSGDAVPLRGGAVLRVLVGAPAYEGGDPTYLPPVRAEVVDVSGYDTFRQVAWAGSFEGLTGLGLGTRARLPFRVFLLPGAPGADGSARLVVDVSHGW